MPLGLIGSLRMLPPQRCKRRQNSGTTDMSGDVLCVQGRGSRGVVLPVKGRFLADNNNELRKLLALSGVGQP